MALGILLLVNVLSVILLSVAYAECRYAECRYESSECHYAECRGAFRLSPVRFWAPRFLLFRKLNENLPMTSRVRNRKK